MWKFHHWALKILLYYQKGILCIVCVLNKSCWILIYLEFSLPRELWLRFKHSSKICGPTIDFRSVILRFHLELTRARFENHIHSLIQLYHESLCKRKDLKINSSIHPRHFLASHICVKQTHVWNYIHIQFNNFRNARFINFAYVIWQM